MLRSLVGSEMCIRDRNNKKSRCESTSSPNTSSAASYNASASKKPYAMKWVPDYARMIASLVAQFFVGIDTMVRGIPGLQWFHIVFPPLGIKYFASLWLAGFVNIPDEVPRDDFSADWFTRYVKLVKLPNEDSSPTTEKKGLWWIPQTDVRWAMTHGLMQRGISHFNMFCLVLLFFPQLMVGSMWRCLQHHFNFGAWKPNKADAHQTYLAIVNTSLATYYNDKEDAFIYYDVIILADRNKGQRKFSTIKIFCDHESGVILKMELTIVADPVFRIKSDFITLDAVNDTVVSNSGTHDADSGAMEQINMFVVQVGGLMTHPQVHWWANGVVEVTQWKLHKKSGVWVNFLNYLSAFQSLFFYHAPFVNDTDLLARNLVGGMPVHSNLPKAMMAWSRMHRMTAEARELLKEHFSTISPPMTDGQLNCLMCATIYHAADHHYLDKFSARNGLCDILETDFRTMRLCIVAGYKWIGTKFLCKQYLDDPVCKILYEVALKHDPEFANGILTMGIAI
eukprot:TRINITY_DN6334_c0_g1_i15.p1 TRINITY_DN6334_c0_g1~~TRINITY_DN6334_c0_g1_i15.p1  ORF type:complete len:509 (-),score=195.77 TRINITY_DN6334_c0_g1_i15:433-1959(-)